MFLRPATEDDIPFLIKGFAETHAGVSHADSTSYEKRIRQDILSSTPKAYADVFTVNDNAVGYVVYAQGYFMSTGSIMWISQLYIDKKYRGHYFRDFIKLLKLKAKKLGAVRFVWCSEIHNERLSKLWRLGKAKNLNESFSFWSTSTEV